MTQQTVKLADLQEFIWNLGVNTPKAIVLEIPPLTGFRPLWQFREWSKFINLDDTAKQTSVTFAKAITLALQTKRQCT